MGTVTADRTAARSVPGQWWVRARGPLLAVALLLAAGLVFAVLRSGERQGLLDPRSSERHGSRAVAELLKDRGVSVRTVTTTRAAAAGIGPDATLLITEPDLLTPAQHRSLHTAFQRAGGRTVLLAPGGDSLATWAPETEAHSATEVAPRLPQCALPAARRAGTTDIGGIRYSTPARDARRCYPSRGLPTLVVRPVGPDARGGDTVLLGAPDILFNQGLDEQGNASLALQLLGSRPHLVWYLPSLDDPAAADGDESLIELIPTGWHWGALQLAIAAVLAALWRARRLGPLLTERLPVTVRASETVEGHARLYHRADARAQAADTLRSATRTRLARLLGVPPAQQDDPDILPSAVRRHLDAEARSAADVPFILFGPAPVDDAALIRLADDLDALLERVGPAPRHDTTPPPRDKDRTS